ncbi:hypothetical protein GGQ87_002687 [Brevundimonas alba]|uniref:Uncharacterized protein n=1 Tax=Brevundimonas alba TaxID=74314 RepID=A0A7X5YMK0_9CAUL|nr:hypothetical protein [Brevundimonas alba]NJC42392.1 hypothetical protein [Brevundimonas alba]
MTQPHIPPPHTRRSAETWEAARRDYVAGTSAAAVAERYGLAVRTVRRRALTENWIREDVPALCDRLRDRLRADLGDGPERNFIENHNGEDMYELLFVPSAAALGDFAFRRAAETAAVGGPAEAAAWLRVARLAGQVGDRHDVGRDPFTPADRIRARMAATPSGDDEAVDEEPDLADVADLADEFDGHFDPSR